MDGAKPDCDRIHGWIDGSPAREDGAACHVQVLRSIDTTILVDHPATLETAHAGAPYVMVPASEEHLRVQERRLVIRELEACFVMRSGIGGEQHHRLPDSGS